MNDRLTMPSAGALASPGPVDAAVHEGLLQFLYVAPVGLVQVAHDGAVELMNPMAASLLMPLAGTHGLDNLFETLAGAAPQLHALVAAFDGPHGPIGEALQIDVSAGGGAVTHTLSLNLLKLDGRRLMAILRDVTEDVQREQRTLRRELNAAARIDSLTDMPNRAAVREYLHVGLSRPKDARVRHCAVLFINCDRFKQINDGHGYAAGDEVLALLAHRLRSVLQHVARGEHARDPIAARLGGDEFAVVLDDLARGDDVHIVAQRILGVLEQPLVVRAHQLHCTVSMGVVMRAQFAGDPDAVLQDASIAMVEAKRTGGARYVVFQPEMRERAARRADIEEDLRTALARDQLFVVYQPVVGFRRDGDHETIDTTAGVEALVRWRHPVRGVVPPLEFIGIAEECGLIGAVGHYVLETACRQFVAWRDALGDHAPRTLAVNLSRGQLDQPGFVASVAEVLRRTGMRPQSLQLEVTESLAAQDETVVHRLQELKALGLTLALDDFGTGYSSLSSLHLLPVDTVKIDRSFVSEAVTSSHHRVLIEATVRVAGSLSMNTVAEGIETAEQSAVIAALGCKKGQGYFFSRPLAAAELAFWAVAGRGSDPA